MKISEVIKSLPASNAAIKNTASSEPKDGWYPAYSASGQDVWLPDSRYTQRGIVVSAVGARCGKAFKADGEWNICANTHPLSVDETKALRDYCWYMINNEDWWIKGGTAQPFIKVKDSFNRDFNFPSIPEQKLIVKRLDTVRTLIDRKRQQIEKLDELVKARFVEMFDCDYEEVELSELGKISTGSTPPMKNKDFYENADMPFYKPGDFIDGVSNIDCSESFVDARAESVSRIMDSGTVAVTCIGIIGKIGIIKRRGICNQQINFIVPNDKVNSIYLAYAIDTKKKFMQEKANAPVVPILNKTNFSKVTIPLAPVKLQNQFATFVTQVDKSKFALVKSIKLLKKSPFNMLLGLL